MSTTQVYRAAATTAATSARTPPALTARSVAAPLVLAGLAPVDVEEPLGVEPPGPVVVAAAAAPEGAEVLAAPAAEGVDEGNCEA